MAFSLLVGSGWRTRVDEVWHSFPGIVPVVKGNGYGFGRPGLVRLATNMGADEIAVGTVHELADIAVGGPTPIVLTPAVATETAGLRPDAVLTVGSMSDVEALAGTTARVIVKIASSMRRYGVAPAEAAALATAAQQQGLTIHGYAIHLPLKRASSDNATEATELLTVVPDGSVAYISHVTADEQTTLSQQYPKLRLRTRVGTSLWLGDKDHLKLVADVVLARPIAEGDVAGYRSWAVDYPGHLMMVTAGTAHGVQALPDGRSPFHFSRSRLPLHEPPHMHTSMLFVSSGHPRPVVGDQVEVQQPLSRVWPDQVRFL